LMMPSHPSTPMTTGSSKATPVPSSMADMKPTSSSIEMTALMVKSSNFSENDSMYVSAGVLITKYPKRAPPTKHTAEATVIVSAIRFSLRYRPGAMNFHSSQKM